MIFKYIFFYLKFKKKKLFLGIKVELIVEEIVWIWVKDHQGIFLDMLPKH